MHYSVDQCEINGFDKFGNIQIMSVKVGYFQIPPGCVRMVAKFFSRSSQKRGKNLT